MPVVPIVDIMANLAGRDRSQPVILVTATNFGVVLKHHASPNEFPGIRALLTSIIVQTTVRILPAQLTAHPTTAEMLAGLKAMASIEASVRGAVAVIFAGIADDALRRSVSILEIGTGEVGAITLITDGRTAVVAVNAGTATDLAESGGYAAVLTVCGFFTYGGAAIASLAA